MTMVVITGASKGLGKALAYHYAKSGHDLTLIARQNLTDLALELGQFGTTVEHIQCDLAQPEARQALIKELENTSIDIFINNAGMGFYKPFLEHSPSEHQAIIDLNLSAVVHLTYGILPTIKHKGSGQIINIASDLSFTPLDNMSVYAATKFGLRGFSLSLSKEVRASGIRVTLINPGMIDTAFNNGTENSQNHRAVLSPNDLAKQIIDITSGPDHLVIDEVTLHAIEQAY